MKLPEPWKNCMITYEKEFSFGEYNSQKRKEIVTRKGFYSDLFDNFAIPPDWAHFKGVLLPNGFGGDKLKIEEVIDWKYCED